jgi:hypothetical protein
LFDVDPKSITLYEISAKEAEPYMQQEVTQAMEQISSLFSNFETATTQQREAALQIDQSFPTLAQTLTQSLTKLQNLTNEPE